MYVIF